MHLALEGIKILELARTAPASFCTMVMADLGAEVLKVEALPEAGLPNLGSGISPWGEGSEKKAAYNAINRNKKSIGMNLRSAEGQKIFMQLAKNVDVIVEGFRPGVVKRLNIDFDKVSQINPGIIYCSISGYGQDGPYKMLPGHDANYLSISGLLDQVGEPNGRPVIPPNLIADYAGGSLNGVIGILTAILARQKTGKGQMVDISMTDGTFNMMAINIKNYYSNNEIPRRGSDVTLGGYPPYNVYETKDGKYVTIACTEPHFWEGLCNEVGREDFIPFAAAEGEKQDEIFAHLRKAFLTRTRDEWFDKLSSKGLPIAKVNNLEEALQDPQLLHRQMVIKTTHPSLGEIKQVGFGIKLSDTPAKIRNLAPVLGQQTDETLLDLGFGAEEIERLRKDGTVG